MRKHRVAATAALLISAGSLSSPLIAHADSAATYYVNDGAGITCSDSTADSATTPYCTIQAAVNAATTPGDTVIVRAGHYSPFTVTSSGTAAAPITIESSTQAFRSSSVYVNSDSTATPVISVNDASYVDLTGFNVTQSLAAGAVELSGSTHIALTSLNIEESKQTAEPTVAIGAGSSSVTVSRSEVTSASTAGAIVAQGGSNDVFTTDYLPTSVYGPSLVLDQTTDSDVVGNTIGHGCGEDGAVRIVDLTGAKRGAGRHQLVASR